MAALENVWKYLLTFSHTVPQYWAYYLPTIQTKHTENNNIITKINLINGFNFCTTKYTSISDFWVPIQRNHWLKSHWWMGIFFQHPSFEWMCN